MPSIAGQKVGALAVTEPDTGSDVAAIRTRAEKDGDHYVINGAKTFITNGADGDFVTVACKTDPEAGLGGISLIVVEHDTPGFKVAKRLKKMGWYCSDTAELSFEDVRVPASQLVGQENMGFYYIMECFQLERLVGAAIGVGSADIALAKALEYMAQRHAFGKPLTKFQALTHRLADLAAETEAARQLTYHAAWLLSQGAPCARECTMAKLLATELGKRAADQCLQCFGGYGFMEEYPLARFYRDARVGTIVAGTSEIMREILARLMTGDVDYKPVTQRGAAAKSAPRAKPAPGADQAADQSPEQGPEHTVEGLMDSLPQRFRPDKLPGYAGVFHFRLAGADNPEWTVSIADGVWRRGPGPGGRDSLPGGDGRGHLCGHRDRPGEPPGRVHVRQDQGERYRPDDELHQGLQAGRQVMGAAGDLPLSGTLVLDASRMLPGAVLARQLLDLGARLIKVEDPAGGDPMRHTPPQVGGMGAGFATFYRGACSLALDLRRAEHQRAFRRLAQRAEVVVESFRPGSMETWGLGYERLSALNPGLVYVALSSFGREGPYADRIGHDLNFTALSGLYQALSTSGVPRVQLVDVSSGLMAATAILGALLARARTGQGRRVDQPLAAGVLPLLTWAWADASAGGGSLMETLLGGSCPCYQVYECAGGGRLALGAVEPKFWGGFLEVLGLGQYAGAGYDAGPAGQEAAEAVTRRLGEHPLKHWLELCDRANLPVAPVNDLEASRAAGWLEACGLAERTPLPDGGGLEAPGPYQPGVGRTPSRAAPEVGRDNQAIAREFGLQELIG